MNAAWNWTCFLCTVVVATATETAVPFAEGAETRQLTIVAQGSFVNARLISSSNLSKEPADLLIIRNSQTAYPLVIHSAQELAAVSHRPPNTDEAAAVTDDVNLEMEVEQRLLTLLELAEIDWEKKMVVAVLATDSYRRPPRWKFVSLSADDDTLIVEVHGSDGEFGCGTPSAIAVVERFDGKVAFTDQWAE